MEVNCEYSFDPCEASRVYYTCFINEQHIPVDKELKFIGEHKYGNTNNDVAEVNFSNCNMTRVPQGLTKTFPNLMSLSICGSNLKDLQKNDLIEYKELEVLGFANNCIEFLPGDLFDGFNRLNEISFVGNKLKNIGPNILDGLNNLKLVDFSNNTNYTKFYSDDPANVGTATLQAVKAELRDQYCHIPEIPINNNQKYEDEIRVLKRNSQDFNQKNLEEIQALKRTIQHLILENQELKKSQAGLLQQIQASKDSKPPAIQKGIHSDLKNFLQDDSFKDFEIIIDERKFKVHKFMLAARSPFLADFFTNNPDTKCLRFELPVNIFESILKFLYTDEFPQLEDGEYLKLFSVSDKLKIEDLKDFAVAKILENLNGDNALEVLAYGNKFAQRQLRLKAFEEIKKKYPRVEFFDDWAFETDRVKQVIELYNQKEEARVKMEEKFKDLKSED